MLYPGVRGVRRTFFLLLSLAFAGAGFCASPQVLWVKKIWGTAPHSMCTDLIRYQDKFFCSFREGQSHASHHIKKQDNGKLRILESLDGENWKSAALIADEGVDLRDPHLSITPTGKLMIVAGGTKWGPEGQYLTRQTRVFFSSNGREWSPPQPILGEGDWLWRVTWHNGRAYGVSYHGGGGNRVLARKAFLYSSADGIRYELHTELQGAGINETTVRFLANDEMILLARRELENTRGYIGTAKPPYKDVRWHETEFRFGGPNFIDIPGQGLWAGSRLHTATNPSDPRSAPARMSLAKMSRESYEPVLILPSAKDNSYPGMVWHDNHLWVSYYSTHEDKTSIYLAKLRF